MPQHGSALQQENLEFATGPTIRASYRQTCGWCSGAVAESAPITYTRESGWCHESCTTNEADAAGA